MRLFANNFTTTIDTPPDDLADTTFSVVDVTNLPPESAFAGNNHAIITVANVDGTFEVMRLESYVASTRFLTVTRGDALMVEGHVDATPSTTILAGARCELRMTKGALEEFMQRDNDTLYGGVFGATPPAPNDVVTIVTKHTTDATNPVPVLLTGELALNVKNHILYIGAVDAADSPEVRVLFQGLFIQSTPPSHPVGGALWLDISNPNAFVLKVLYIYVWVPVFGFPRIGTDLVLDNAVKLQGYNAGATVLYDLAYVSSANEITLGDSDAALVRVRGVVVEVEPTLRLKSPGGTYGDWTFSASSYGNPLLTLNASSNSSYFIVNVKNAVGANHGFLFTADGRLTLPAGVDPVSEDDAVPLRFLTAAVSGAKSFLVAGRVAANGAAVGAVDGWASTMTIGGVYTITLDAAHEASDVNNMVVTATAIQTSPLRANVCQVTIFSTTQFVVQIGSGTSYEDFQSAFSFIVIDTGA